MINRVRQIIHHDTGPCIFLIIVSIVFVYTGLLFGCATIGSSTVSLSAEIGERITDMQAPHEAAVKSYFDVERARVEQFLAEKWEPLFLVNMLGVSGILTDLQSAYLFDSEMKQQISEAIQIYLTDSSETEAATNRLLAELTQSRENEPAIVRRVLNTYIEDDVLEGAVTHINSLLSTDDPARMILDFAEDAHHEMMLQRRLLLEPLDQAEQEVILELRTVYAELISAQSLLTARLASAAKLKEQQDAVFRTLTGADIDTLIQNHLTTISNSVSSFLSIAENSMSGITEGDTPDLATFRGILENLLNPPPFN